MTRPAVLLGAAALVVAALVGLPMRAASADTYSACSTTQGTLVAVDFGHFGGPIVRGCDTTPPKRGIDLLTDEGFRTTGTSHDGPQFICRIGNEALDGGTQYPTPGQDPCVATPPSSAYWSYWLAEPGDTSWHYSQLGAFSNAPKTGEIQLWIFGGTDIQGSQGNPTNGFPTCSPASLRSSNPTPCTGGGSSGGSGGSGSGSGGSGGGSHSSSPAARPHHHAPSSAHRPTSGPANPAASTASRAGGSASARPGAATTASTPVPPGGAGPVGAGSPAAPGTGSGASGSAGAGSSGDASARPVAIDAKQASKHTSTGSAVPLVLGLALVVVFAIGGWWVVRRRRPGIE